jgi:hypothetical protein
MDFLVLSFGCRRYRRKNEAIVSLAFHFFCDDEGHNARNKRSIERDIHKDRDREAERQGEVKRQKEADTGDRDSDGWMSADSQ